MFVLVLHSSFVLVLLFIIIVTEIHVINDSTMVWYLKSTILCCHQFAIFLIIKSYFTQEKYLNIFKLLDVIDTAFAKIDVNRKYNLLNIVLKFVPLSIILCNLLYEFLYWVTNSQFGSVLTRTIAITMSYYGLSGGVFQTIVIIIALYIKTKDLNMVLKKFNYADNEEQYFRFETCIKIHFYTVSVIKLINEVFGFDILLMCTMSLVILLSVIQAIVFNSPIVIILILWSVSITGIFFIYIFFVEFYNNVVR